MTRGGPRSQHLQRCSYRANPSGEVDDFEYSILHIAGEWTAAPSCIDSEPGTYETPHANRFSVQGISALILDWDWFPPDAKDQYDGTLPFEIYLHPNE